MNRSKRTIDQEIVMSIEIKNRTKRTIQYFGGIMLFIIFQIGPFFLDRAGLSHFSGICSAFQYASCLVLVRTNHKKGIITSIILMGFSALNLIRIITLSGATVVVSGIFNQIFYLVGGNRCAHGTA